mmetsp:Transcript_7933/g.16619  ORF Transcript_7933/g.16619 Transcript_7933/m.16619 type:complete len:266 (-) Transcript_7933:449-1246(-)
MIQGGMGAKVVGLDVLHLDRFLHAGHLIQFPTIVENAGRVRHTARIGFEIDNVHLVETHQRHKETNVRFRHLITGHKALLGQQCVKTIKGLGQFTHRLVICALRGGKPTTVHPIVNAGVDPFVGRVNGFAQRFGINVERGIRGVIVEFRVEHANDFARFVTDNLLGLLVVQNGHRVFAVGVFDGFVNFPDTLGADQGIGFGVGVVSGKGPAVALVIGPGGLLLFGGRSAKHPPGMFVRFGARLLPNRVHDRDGNRVLQSLHTPRH